MICSDPPSSRVFVAAWGRKCQINGGRRSPPEPVIKFSLASGALRYAPLTISNLPRCGLVGACLTHNSALMGPLWRARRRQPISSRPLFLRSTRSHQSLCGWLVETLHSQLSWLKPFCRAHLSLRCMLASCADTITFVRHLNDQFRPARGDGQHYWQ